MLTGALLESDARANVANATAASIAIAHAIVARFTDPPVMTTP
jgi:hypothetical protein